MDAVNTFVTLRFGRGYVYEIAARVQPREERQSPSPKEPCVMLKGGIAVFFYVDGIIFCHRKRDEEKVQEVIKGLKTEYQMSALGELKWFLEIHVLQDRSQRLLWLS
jgi:hypothetical protein